jgi:hypothetical protein
MSGTGELVADGTATRRSVASPPLKNEGVVVTNVTIGV